MGTTAVGTGDDASPLGSSRPSPVQSRSGAGRFPAEPRGILAGAGRSTSRNSLSSRVAAGGSTGGGDGGPCRGRTPALAGSRPARRGQRPVRYRDRDGGRGQGRPPSLSLRRFAHAQLGATTTGFRSPLQRPVGDPCRWYDRPSPPHDLSTVSHRLCTAGGTPVGAFVGPVTGSGHRGRAPVRSGTEVVSVR